MIIVTLSQQQSRKWWMMIVQIIIKQIIMLDADTIAFMSIEDWEVREWEHEQKKKILAEHFVGDKQKSWTRVFGNKITNDDWMITATVF